METHQLTFFSDGAEKLDAGIQRLQKAKFRSERFKSFVNSLAAQMQASPAGSLVIAATPSALATEHTVDELRKLAEATKQRGYGRGMQALACVVLPHASSARATTRQLPGAYSQVAAKLGHIHSPQFALQFGEEFTPPDPLQRICGLIRNQAADYYLVTNGQCLAPAGATSAELIDQMRFFIQLSRQSAKTHVLFMGPLTASELISHPELAGEVVAKFLRPYHAKDRGAFVEFSAILNGYDANMPRAKGFALSDHAVEIMTIVGGCGYRLNRWVLKTLAEARASGADAVNWSDFRLHAPSLHEQEQAKKEANEIFKWTGGLMHEPRKTRPSRGRPGQRKLHRDPVGQDCDAA